MQLNDRPIKFIRLFQTTHAEDLGNLGPTVDPNETGKLKDTKLIKVPEGVVLQYPTKAGTGTHCFLISNINIMDIQFEADYSQTSDD